MKYFSILPLAFLGLPLFAGELSGPAGVAPRLKALSLSPTLFPTGSSRVDFEVDHLQSDDIQVTRGSFKFEQQRGPLRLQVGYGQTRHEVDYAPPSGTFSLPARRDERTEDYNFNVVWAQSSALRWTVSGTYSEGFTDHRSLWISEFYDQSFAFFPSFEAADPEAYSVSLGAEWDYAPGRGTLAVTLGFAQTDVVPGIGIDPLDFDDVVVAESLLDTLSASLRWEYTLNSRVRMQQTLRFSETEGRSLRSQLQSDWAFALSDPLTLRLQLGGALENPGFESYYAGLTFAYELGAGWQAELGYRIYNDTGEINSSNFNTTAPGLESQELSLGLLWSNGKTSVRVGVAAYETDYDELTNPLNLVFANLYGDRDHIASRFAITHRF